MDRECAGSGAVMFLAGLVIGAGVALLFAPQSGKKTRREIARRAEDTKEYLEEAGEELIAKGRELIEQARAAADERLKAVSEKIRPAKA